jgi:hypothetical protein
MNIYTEALEGFIILMGVLIGSYVVGEIIHLYNQKQANQAFQLAINQMTNATITAVESIKSTTTLGINALLNMDTVRDINSLAQKKADLYQMLQQQTK